MPASKPVELKRPLKFDDAMRKAMRVPPEPKKAKQRKVWKKKRR